MDQFEMIMWSKKSLLSVSIYSAPGKSQAHIGGPDSGYVQCSG